jgi:hypothetical protein
LIGHRPLPTARAMSHTKHLLHVKHTTQSAHAVRGQSNSPTRPSWATC